MKTMRLGDPVSGRLEAGRRSQVPYSYLAIRPEELSDIRYLQLASDRYYLILLL